MLLFASQITLRGSSEDGAVLCTRNATFSVKEAETSNSLLLVPSLVLPTSLEKTGQRALVASTVEGVFYKYLEVLPAQPTTKRLHTVLREKSYKGGNSDQEHGWALSELLDTVQASEEELLEGQFDLEVCWLHLPFQVLRAARQSEWMVSGSLWTPPTT